MTEWVHRCMVVVNAYTEFARKLAQTIAGTSGEKMWNVPLSADGKYPATHWVSSGPISPEFASIMPLKEYDADGLEIILSPGYAAIAASLATKAEMPTTESEVQSLFDHSDITEQEAQTALSRLNLVLVAEDPTITD